MLLHTEGNLIETEDIEIQHGIFQGKSLSPICQQPLKTYQVIGINFRLH